MLQSGRRKQIFFFITNIYILIYNLEEFNGYIKRARAPGDISVEISFSFEAGNLRNNVGNPEKSVRGLQRL